MFFGGLLALRRSWGLGICMLSDFSYTMVIFTLGTWAKAYFSFLVLGLHRHAALIYVFCSCVYVCSFISLGLLVNSPRQSFFVSCSSPGWQSWWLRVGDGQRL